MGEIITIKREDVKRMRANIVSPSPIILKLPLLRQKYGLKELKISQMVQWLSKNSFIVMARGGDGSNSSWIVAIDPEDSDQRLFLGAWCRAREYILEILKNFKEYFEEINAGKDVPEVIRAIVDIAEEYIRVKKLKNDYDVMRLVDSILAFTMVDDSDPKFPIVVSIVNPHVKLTSNPCLIFRALRGDSK